MIKFTIPLPPRELSPNASNRMPWIVKSKAKKAYREAVGWTARLARGPGTNPLFSRCQIQYEIIIRREPGGYLPRDADNATASLKSAQDGMKDACLFSDDSHDRVRVLPPIFTKPGKNDKRSGIKVTVTAWENEK